MRNTNEQAVKLGELLLEIEKRQIDYQNTCARSARKRKGQFFTDIDVAGFMSKCCPELDKTVLRILDPGAGFGILSVSALVRLLSSTGDIAHIHVDMVENDRDVLPELHRTACEIEKISLVGPVALTCSVIEDNFIHMACGQQYDLAICNPPYMKLSRRSDEACEMNELVYGQPNLYALFCCKAIGMLATGGRYAFITPRSWTSGAYFRKIREYILEHTNLAHVHLFDSRSTVFKNSDVLQETMIWSGQKVDNEDSKHPVLISASADSTFASIGSFHVDEDDLIRGNSDIRLGLPATRSDAELLRAMSCIHTTFESMGYAFKTGPVVEFRNQERILVDRSANSIPMLRAAHIQNGKFVFPVETRKAQFVDASDAPALKVPNTPTVIVKRLSAKEEQKRLQCCEYYPIRGETFISLENHVNYLVRKDRRALTSEEVKWVYELLSSDAYDRYFRMISGSTQVNSQDLNGLPVASVEIK